MRLHRARHNIIMIRREFSQKLLFNNIINFRQSRRYQAFCNLPEATQRYQSTNIRFILLSIIVLRIFSSALTYRHDSFIPQTLPFPHLPAKKQASNEGGGLASPLPPFILSLDRFREYEQLKPDSTRPLFRRIFAGNIVVFRGRGSIPSIPTIRRDNSRKHSRIFTTYLRLQFSRKMIFDENRDSEYIMKGREILLRNLGRAGAFRNPDT